MFPVLRERLADAAADLSGGQQQMLALGMAFIAKPRVLLIDELSLGLAPVVVGQLLPLVRRLADDGVAVILVEQSVNVALTVAERAYFMERGTIRFSGPTAELLDRPDLLRRCSSPTSPRRSLPRRRCGRRRPASRRARRHSRSPGSADRSAATRPSSDVSFAVGSGEIVGMIGPNGAGKTTLFDLISGYVPADTGRVVLDGRDITSDSPTVRARLRSRAQLPGRSAVPRHDRGRDDRRRAGAVDDAAQRARRRAAIADGVRRRGAHNALASTS